MTDVCCWLTEDGMGGLLERWSIDCSRALKDERIDQSFMLFGRLPGEPSSEPMEFDWELKRRNRSCERRGFSLTRCGVSDGDDGVYAGEISPVLDRCVAVYRY